MRIIQYNKACEIEDFSDTELSEIIRDVFRHESHLSLDFPKGAEYPKYWEMAMGVRALRHFDVLHPDAIVLCIGAGTETAQFYLAHHAKQVFATDLYLDTKAWRELPPSFMLIDPSQAAPYEFDSNRLVVQHMDSRVLRYPENCFDGILSFDSLENMGSLEYVANTAYEMGRVLKPGGVLTISTQYRISGPPGGIGWDGCILFSREELQRYVVEASGLQLVDDLNTDLSENTLNTKRDLTKYAVDTTAYQGQPSRYTHAGHIAWSKQPYLVHVHQGYVFCSIQLTLRKNEHYPFFENAWAKPSQSIIDSANHTTVPLLNLASPQLLSDLLLKRTQATMTASNDNELAVIQNLFRAWDGARIRGWYNANLRRLPLGLGKLGRTMVRVLQLGRVFEAQAQLYSAMIDHQANLGAYINQLNVRLSEMSSQFETIVHQTELLQKQIGSLAEFSVQIAELRDQLTRLDMRVGQASQHQIESYARLEADLQRVASHQAQLEANLREATAQQQETTAQQQEITARQQEATIRQSNLEHQVRLNTSYIRLFQQQLESTNRADSSSTAEVRLTRAELLDLLRALEHEMPDLAQAAAVELSIQDGMAEDILLEGASYFNERMSSAGTTYRVPNDVCYHIDFTDEWNRPKLFESAVSRLQSGGKLVIVTMPDHDSSISVEGLGQIANSILTLASGKQVRAYIWQRA
jgi:SAM-dependent methyltransferase